MEAFTPFLKEIERWLYTHNNYLLYSALSMLKPVVQPQEYMRSNIAITPSSGGIRLIYN